MKGVHLRNNGYTVPKSLLPLIPLLVLFVYLIAGSFYQIEADEEGVLMRLGKYSKTVSPGLHFKVPFIDKLIQVPVKRQLKQEYGTATAGRTNKWQAPNNRNELLKQKNMVTGDLNAAEVQWTIQYQINDPVNFLFNVEYPEETLQDACESIMRETVGDRTVDEVITVGRSAIEAEVLDKLRDLLAKYEMGINVSLVQITNVSPPGPVVDSFNDVERAKQEKKEKVNIARAQKDQVVPKAKGLALGKVSNSEGYYAQRVNEAMGDASAFNSLYNEYLKAPEVTKRRIYLETLAEVMPKLGKKVILDESAGNVLPMLDLGAQSKGERN